MNKSEKIKFLQDVQAGKVAIEEIRAFALLPASGVFNKMFGYPGIGWMIDGRPATKSEAAALDKRYPLSGEKQIQFSYGHEIPVGPEMTF